jgi:rSAM/selenodomain-associated transferase 2
MKPLQASDAVSRGTHHRGPRISLIVPLLNEAAILPAQLDYYQSLLETRRVDEVILADGGSHDGSPELIRARPDFRLVNSVRGRAVQMNAGAAVAGGDVLLFLHADCRLEPRAFTELRTAVEMSDIVGGAFRQQIDDPHWFPRLIEFGSTLRGGLLDLFYGDQGIFCRREAFAAIGGWPPVPIMEEYPFCQALRRHGRVRLLRSRIVSSARRFRARGYVRQWLRNWSFVARYLAGAPLEALKREYPDIRG